MSHEDTVKSIADDPLPQPEENADLLATSESVRWWIRRPELGIAAGLITGIAGIWILSALGWPSHASEAAFLYMVTLPIALLLPALALLGTLVVRSSFSALHGRRRLAMALPALAAAASNILAIGMFLRFVLQILDG